MSEVFINYRTGDGEKAAVVIDLELSRRFGKDRIFYASKSIRAGERYPQELIRNVRSSSLVLAVLGPAWIDSPALRIDGDWVRKEILEAFDCGVSVVPVLDGRRTERLRRADLPVELQRLADVQSVRLDLQHDARAGLGRLGDLVAELVPALRVFDRDSTAASDPSEGARVSNNVSGNVHGPLVQARDTGDAGVVIKDARGPVHTGQGDVNNDYSQHSSGDGATHIAGDNHGGVAHRFGRPHKRADENR
ncbi:TIR domain-containing protein [Streptomyces sp. SID3343]|uniref:toll/interleukin-1 receptor domain-containing protein n=1 Tax=Streptomyces sp. SID3343 TaxID=2690260 RepID=UPI00136DDEBB|nr:TIR domain-containing protein [Streptomyces sp. SID3343]MYV97340.1 TIR domain-containing protein [Streptomyces sp. SID3343]